MHFIRQFWLFIALLYLSACSVQPKKLEYGVDTCINCKMTIVDSKHAAQIVTTKGKVYTFDAVECMLQKMAILPEEKIGLVLVCDYLNPGELIRAEDARFFITERVPSPMGANLSAVSDPGAIPGIVQNDEVQILNWEELKSFKLN